MTAAVPSERWASRPGFRASPRLRLSPSFVNHQLIPGMSIVTPPFQPDWPFDDREPGHSRPPDPPSPALPLQAGAGGPAHHRFAQSLLRYFVKLRETGRYSTFDLVEIDGSWDSPGRFLLRVNGGKVPTHSRAEQVMVLLLVEHARLVAARKGVPVYVPAKSMVTLVEELTREGAPLTRSWQPVYSEFYHAVSNVRSKLSSKRLNPHLIESGEKGAGYRLSTPFVCISYAGCKRYGEEFWAGLFGSLS